MDFNWLPAVTSLIIFSIVFVVLYLKVWPSIVQGLDARQQKIRDEIAGAEQAREQAKAALREYEQSLASARQEANQMIARARADAKAVGEELRARNEAELTELKNRAMREIDGARAASIADLHAQAASLATAIAGRILQREITVEDQQRLVDESLRQLARSGTN
jgi:F-type H+-transporting ATPase subunit b